MNYSKNIKRTSMVRRILISWLAIAILFTAIGFGCGFGIKAIQAKKSVETIVPEDPTPIPEVETPTETPTETIIYGKLDGRIFEAELPEEYAGNVAEFVPLDLPIDSDLQEFIYYLSEAYDIDYSLVLAIIRKESNFKIDVMSDTEGYGLMQVNEINHEKLAEQLGITDFLEPYDNIRAGMFLLRKLFEKYKTPDKVLMAYHLGETGARKLWDQGVFEINYSKCIFEFQAEYTAEIERSKNNDQM